MTTKERQKLDALKRDWRGYIRGLQIRIQQYAPEVSQLMLDLGDAFLILIDRLKLAETTPEQIEIKKDIEALRDLLAQLVRGLK